MSQFVSGEFVNSHFLSSLQFFQANSSPALFDILHTHNLRYPIPNDWNELAFEIHECKCLEYQLYILASRFQISAS